MILPRGLGLCVPWQNAETDSGYYDFVLDRFKPNCWYNYKMDAFDPDYFRMVWDIGCLAQYSKQLESLKDDRVTLLCNEPERTDQSNTAPEAAAGKVREWASLDLGPFAVPGILWNQGGRDWWSEYLRHDPPEPNAYHVHIYAYDAASWRSQFYDAKRMFSDKPLIISECAAWNMPTRYQIDVMNVAYMVTLSGDCDAAFWFSSEYGEFSQNWLESDLLTKEKETTEVGAAFIGMGDLGYGSTYVPILMG